jgi:hypothetical protein
MKVRRVLLSGLALAITGLAVALTALHEDLDIRADQFIARPPADVWRVLVDQPAYPLWNPFITRLDGPLREGATLQIVLGRGADAMRFAPVVLRVRPDEVVCWRGSVGPRGLFDGTHCLRLHAVAGGTRVEQSERFSGWLAGRLTRAVAEDTRRQFIAMNAALRQRVESTAR